MACADPGLLGLLPAAGRADPRAGQLHGLVLLRRLVEDGHALRRRHLQVEAGAALGARLVGELSVDHSRTVAENRGPCVIRRAVAALEALPADLPSEYVFVSPETGKPYRDFRKMWIAER